MKGHVQDRWYRHKRDSNDNPVYGEKGRPVLEKTDLYGKGLRYKVHYYDDEDKEHSKSFPDKAKGRAEDFLTKMQHDVLSGDFVDPKAGDVVFREYAKQWMKGQSSDAHTRQTVKSRLENGIFPFLGDKPLRTVARTDTIRNWMDWMEKPVADGGKNYLHPIVRSSSILFRQYCMRHVMTRKSRRIPVRRKASGARKKMCARLFPGPRVVFMRSRRRCRWSTGSWFRLVVALGCGKWKFLV